MRHSGRESRPAAGRPERACRVITDGDRLNPLFSADCAGTARSGDRSSIGEPVLSQHLKELENAHLIQRTVVPTTPAECLPPQRA
jgi:DNA-binding HxlR family transcriptional regulator